jgi:large subunit ribosomal protein L24
VTQEAPIHISNVALIDPDTKKPTRAGYRIEQDDGARTKTRISRQGGKDI